MQILCDRVGLKGGAYARLRHSIGQILAKPREPGVVLSSGLPDGTIANHTLVKDGWCCWYRKYAPGDTVFEGLENEAREAKKGLWADPQPVPPWEWRKRKRF
jgi:endonuclease YncB( thermonuclease family)